MSEYTAERAHAAAARGAEWLDKTCPTWASEIVLERLNLAQIDFCMLGQTGTCITGERNADYFTVLRSISNDEEEQDAWATERGFKAPFDFRDGIVRYEMLTIAWREIIRERLAVTA